MIARRHCLRAITACVAVGAIPSAIGLAAKKRPVINLEIRKRKVTADEKTIRLTEGEEIQIDWVTDEAVELHLHGYDIYALATPDRKVSMSFRAHTAGRFPISAHQFGHRTVIYLEIYPK